ncbi:MAG: isocitrate/isopropylmalate family dehydrogenase [Candidatus Bathyarchaeota archaeon]|nr:isocitrate/isopropylmalate family dehydrogenase [Candidatus Bathyarchaeota archaeon]
MPRSYKILALIGDGIAEEIVPEAVKVLRAVEEAYGINLEILGPYGFGAKYWVDHDMKSGWDPAITEELVYEADGIFKGPVGLPEWVGRLPGPNMPVDLRPDLDVYANIRPCRLRPGVDSVLVGREAGDIDYVIVRENTEQMYVRVGGFLSRAREVELAVDDYIQTRKGCERVIRFGFELARKGEYKGTPGAPIDGKKRLTCVGKWGICRGDDLFRDTFSKVAEEYSDVDVDYAWVDAWSYWAIMRPNFYDVVVMPNQYGDILSDMSGAIQGSMGLAGALNAGDDHCYAEPTHGSAPDIAGRGIANPTSIILSVGMMLNWMGEKRGDPRLKAAWKGIDEAVDAVLSDAKIRTPDLKGDNSTSQFGTTVAKTIRSSPGS